MPGTKAGSLKGRDTNYKLYGRSYYTTIARLGGSAKVSKGFAKMDKERHLEISSKGGNAPRSSY